MRITFKNDPTPTGLYSVGHPYPITNIKIDGKLCGWISPKSWENDFFTIHLTVKSNNAECGWKNISMKKKFDTNQEARDYVKANLEKIVLENKLEFHYHDD